jgi:hypothetical protein
MKKFSQFFWVMLIMNLFYVSYAFGDFFDGFEGGNLNNFGEQSCCPHSVEVQNTIKNTGNYAVKIFIDTDDYVSGVRRTELVLENDAGKFLSINKNTEYWYEVDYYFPSDFPVETERNYVLWQLHPGFGSPTLSLRSSEDDLSFDGKGTNTNLRLSNVWGSKSSPQEAKYDLGLMSDYLGQWNHITTHFYLSSENDGYIELWINNVKKLDLHNIPTHPNVTSGAYVKCGLYSQSAGATPVEIYVDNVTIKKGSVVMPPDNVNVDSKN